MGTATGGVRTRHNHRVKGTRWGTKTPGGMYSLACRTHCLVLSRQSPLHPHASSNLDGSPESPEIPCKHKRCQIVDVRGRWCFTARSIPRQPGARADMSVRIRRRSTHGRMGCSIPLLTEGTAKSSARGSLTRSKIAARSSSGIQSRPAAGDPCRGRPPPTRRVVPYQIFI